MIRTTTLAALTLALMSATALAQTTDAPNAPPAQLSGPHGPPPSEADEQGPPPDARSDARAETRSRDLYCRRDAAARTGYVSPGQAASHAQTNGTVGGTLGGAALGAIIGSASGHAGAGAAIGAGAGLLAGTAIGSANAQHAASDVERNYAEAYYACMGQGSDDASYAE
ncbi:MAG TPA: YMGG-like glycine zipper-containing protein, partial [Rhizomicrobium sp.]|nr:YMGG-like glycine zipper-containing protein [Rhizomicrobium sp.]